jgi:hypothetical protein
MFLADCVKIVCLYGVGTACTSSVSEAESGTERAEADVGYNEIELNMFDRVDRLGLAFYGGLLAVYHIGASPTAVLLIDPISGREVDQLVFPESVVRVRSTGRSLVAVLQSGVIVSISSLKSSERSIWRLSDLSTPWSSDTKLNVLNLWVGDNSIWVAALLRSDDEAGARTVVFGADIDGRLIDVFDDADLLSGVPGGGLVIRENSKRSFRLINWQSGATIRTFARRKHVFYCDRQGDCVTDEVSYPDFPHPVARDALGNTLLFDKIQGELSLETSNGGTPLVVTGPTEPNLDVPAMVSDVALDDLGNFWVSFQGATTLCHLGLGV